MKEESPLRDPVRLVVELLRIHIVEVLQRVVLQYLGMKPCNTVYGIARADSHVCHLDLSVMDDGHAVHLALVIEFPEDIKAETPVDLLDYVVDTGKEPCEEVYRPLFKCLAHYRMVRIGGAPCHDIPCVVPAESLLVHEYPHELGNRKRGMRIVHLEHDLVGKLPDIVVMLLEAVDSPVKGG